MTPHPRLMSHLQSAEDQVERARQSWDATDLSRCAQCAEHLHQAAVEIRAARQFTGEATFQGADSASKARQRLERLQNSVNRLGRLVDSAIALHRGLALHTGMDEAVSTEVDA